jgi:hypothetical protein
MKKDFLKTLLGACALALLTACGQGTERTPSAYDQANEYIEEGNFESAMVLMRDQLRKNPQDQKARVILASAHAARAGLYVTSYVDLAQDLVDSAQGKEDAYKQRGRVVFERLRARAQGQGEKNLIDTLDDFNQALWSISDVMIKFEKIPEIEKDGQYQDVVAAVRVLNEDHGLYGGPQVYRGVLRLVLFRYHLRHYYKFPEIKDCQVNLAELSQKVESFHQEVKGLLNDFSGGSLMSAQSEKIKAFTLKLDETFSRTTAKMKKYTDSGEEQGDLSLLLSPFGVSCP